jgi:hypothetical protein
VGAAQTKSILAAAALAAALAGCSATSVIDSMPGGMAEPAGAPARPAVAYQYPAVHDMPPPRADQPLTDEQQIQMERELLKVRDQQEGRPANSVARTGQKADQTAKMPPPEANETEAAGGKPNP